MGRKIVYVFVFITLIIFFISRVKASGSDVTGIISNNSARNLINQDFVQKNSTDKLNVNVSDNTTQILQEKPLITVESNSIIKDLFWSIFGGFLGALIALLVDQYREPKLDIIASETANDDITYPAWHLRNGERWKYYRVKVINKPVNKYLSKLINRETAQQVQAVVTFKDLNQSMKGRWAGTLELPAANPLDYLRLANFPDPVTITAGQSEILDVFTKYEHDQEAFGWNNEAYLNNWRTQKYKMIPGNYNIEVKVTSSNGSYKIKSFKAHISSIIGRTTLQ